MIQYMDHAFFYRTTRQWPGSRQPPTGRMGGSQNGYWCIDSRLGDSLNNTRL